MSIEGAFEPRFTETDLPLSPDQLRARETWMMEHGNWREDHSVPSAGEHYRYMWKWDSTKAVVINARRDDPDRSATELSTLLRYVDSRTGFIPNKIFATADGKTWRDYPEAWFFNNNKIGTSYSQPPLEAWAAVETYESFVRAGRQDEGLEFLNAIYGASSQDAHSGLKGGYAYFANHRRNSPDERLIGIVHPNETGRDSDEANKPWLLDVANNDPRLEWLKMQKFGWDIGCLGRDPLRRRVDWIPEQVRGKYWVNDVMFNAMYANNLRHMAEIATLLYIHADTDRDEETYGADAVTYHRMADDVENEILERMWDKSQGYFYNLDGRGNHIPIESATGLFPLMLENIDSTKTAALLEKLEDPRWFDTAYPIPTHAVRSRFYAPDPEGFKNTFTPQWSGTVWADVNQIIGESLGERAWTMAEKDPALSARLMGRATIIASKTHELLACNPKTMEYYSPNTGKGMRVADFMWTNLGLHFEKLEKTRNGIND